MIALEFAIVALTSIWVRDLKVHVLISSLKSNPTKQSLSYPINFPNLCINWSSLLYMTNPHCQLSLASSSIGASIYNNVFIFSFIFQSYHTCILAFSPAKYCWPQSYSRKGKITLKGIRMTPPFSQPNLFWMIAWCTLWGPFLPQSTVCQ